MNARAYLDWNATAPLRPEARAAMLAALDVNGNPSSVHAEGRAARAIIERARAEVAALVGCKPVEVVFTSGATEAAGVLAQRAAGQGVMVDATAHDCLWAHGTTSELDAKAPVGRPAGASLTLAMGLANGETGIVTEPPARENGQWPCGSGMCADRLMLDMVQAVGRIGVSFAWTGADMAIVSAHKLGGPKGVGALIVRDGIDIATLLPGGGQETGRRSGTENVAGIAGFGAAAAAAARDLDAGVWERVCGLRNMLEAALEAAAPDIIVVGKDAVRLPNTSCFAVPGWKGETQVMQMDLAGHAVSAGSACSSGKVKESRVLRAMGFDSTTASSAIRVSLGPLTTQEEVTGFVRVWTEHYRRWRARRAAA